MVVKLERQKNFADEVDSGPLIYGRRDSPGGFEGFVLGMLDEHAISAVPHEGKSERGPPLLHLVHGYQGSGRIRADGDGPLHTSGKSNEQ